MGINGIKRGFQDCSLPVTGIVDSVFEPLVLLDTQLRVVMASGSFYRMFDVLPGDANGRLLCEVIHGRCDSEALQGPLGKILSASAVFGDLEVAFEYEKIGRRSIPVNINRIDGEDGQPLLIVLVFKDAFESSPTEISACDCEDDALRMFRFCINQAPEAVFWMTGEAGFAYVNQQACNSLGYTRGELLGLHLWDIDPVYPKERWNAEWAGYRKDGQVAMQNVETLHRRKDGVDFPVEVSAKHFWFGDNEFHVAFVRDITERKKVEQELDTVRHRSSLDCVFLVERQWTNCLCQ